MGSGALSFKREVVLVPFRAPELFSITIPGKENIRSPSGAGGDWHSWLVHGKAAQTSLLAQKSIFSLQFVSTPLFALTHKHIYTATPVLATCVQASHTNAQCNSTHSCYSIHQHNSTYPCTPAALSEFTLCAFSAYTSCSLLAPGWHTHWECGTAQCLLSQSEAAGERVLFHAPVLLCRAV